MARLARKYSYGAEIKNLNDALYNQLSDSFFIISSVVNTKSTKIVSTIDAPSEDQANAGLDIGDFWVNSNTNNAWIMTSRATLERVTWKQIT